jgi:hypothetical protein
MEKEKKTIQELSFHLAIILIIGIVAGYWLKTTMKPYVSASPEDRKVNAVRQTYDFETAKKKLEEETRQNQQIQPQGQDTQGSCG